MEQKNWQAILTAVLAAVSAAAGQMGAAVGVLLLMMVTDYISGLMAAYCRKELSSRKGLRGIIKKLSYGCVIVVGLAADWLIGAGFGGGEKPMFGLLVTMWLVVNEMISILENIRFLGGPVPEFLRKWLSRLHSGETDEK